MALLWHGIVSETFREVYALKLLKFSLNVRVKQLDDSNYGSVDVGGR